MEGNLTTEKYIGVHWTALRHTSIAIGPLSAVSDTHWHLRHGSHFAVCNFYSVLLFLVSVKIKIPRKLINSTLTTFVSIQTKMCFN